MECTSERYLSYFFALQLISTAVPVVAGLIGRKHLQPWHKVVFAYVTAIFLIESGANYLVHSGKSNAWLYNIAPLVEYCLLTYTFSLLIKHQILSRLLKASIALYIGLWITSKYLMSPILQGSGFFFSVSYFLLLAMSLVSVLGLIKGKINLLTDARFWFSITVLLYASGDLGTCLVSDYLLKNMNFHNIIWVTHLVLSTLVNCLWAGVFICQYRHPSSG